MTRERDGSNESPADSTGAGASSFLVVREDGGDWTQRERVKRAEASFHRWCVWTSVFWTPLGFCGGAYTLAWSMMPGAAFDRGGPRPLIAAIAVAAHALLTIAGVGAIFGRGWAFSLGVAALAVRLFDFLVTTPIPPFAIVTSIFLVAGLVAWRRQSQLLEARAALREPTAETEVALASIDDAGYRAPAPAGAIGRLSRAAADADGRFRVEIGLLGGYWILFGAFLLVVAYAIGDRRAPLPRELAELRSFVAIVAAITGLTWIGLGAAALCRQTWAVYVGLGLAYLTLLTSLSNASVCSVSALAVGLILGHRVLHWAGKRDVSVSVDGPGEAE